MKIAFVVVNEVFSNRVMSILKQDQIDYYTLWEEVKGKGHETEPHLGTRSFPGTNIVLMIAFQSEESLEKLVADITIANQDVVRPSDRIRMFQIPLERIV